HNALGCEEKWISMYQPKVKMQGVFDHLINEGHACISEDTENGHFDKAKMIALDQLNLNNVSLIKIDVEGYEMEVLKGAMETIKRNKPVLIVEIFFSPELNKRLEEIQSLGYRYKSLGDNWIFIPSLQKTNQYEMK